LYTADCHSKPITQLIPGAYYDSFGKPHDGLGFAPHVTAHSHNSTGLCGLAWYDADQFPKEYLGTMFVGNVVTNRVNFDRIEWKGASPVAKELPDFLTSKDRWFRPVDIKLGPDGALYIADFYNKIIGHYEVDLKDPRRDKDRGRLWRVVWTGKNGDAPAAKPHRADFTTAKDGELFEDVLHPNLTVRFLAGHQLRRRAAEGANFAEAVKGFGNEMLTKPHSPALLAWLVHIEGLGDDAKGDKKLAFAWLLAAETAATRDAKGAPVGHLMRALSAHARWGEPERELLLKVLKDFDSVHQKRAIVEAMAAHPHGDFVEPLVGILKGCAADDTHLRHAAKIALRNCLRTTDNWSSSDEPLVAEIALALPGAKAAEYLMSRMKTKQVPAARLVAAAELVARYGTAREEKELFEFLTKDHSALEAIRAGFRGVQARGTKLNIEVAKDLRDKAENAIMGSDVTTRTPYEDNKHIKMFMWGAQVLIALPSAVERAAIGKELLPHQGIAKYYTTIVAAEYLSAEVRAAAAEIVLTYTPDLALVVREQLKKGTTPEAVRERFMLALIASGNRDARPDVVEALSTVPYRVAVPVGLALAATPSGADALLDAVRLGKAPARLLQEKAILERLKASNATDWEKRVNDLTKNLPPADQRVAGLLKTRAAAFATAKPDKDAGAKLFTKHCAACHRIGDAGGKIAPQLDGVGVRGVERLLEDVLDPNRNVDVAFRARSVTLNTEKTLTALMLRVEGEVVVFADLEGKEQRIPTKDIVTNRETQLSAMPANFADVLPETDLYHLLAYLLDQKAKEPKKE
jgi:putative heme-binding domain-containing protein